MGHVHKPGDFFREQGLCIDRLVGNNPDTDRLAADQRHESNFQVSRVVRTGLKTT